jgi:hypothetical protein
MPGARLLASSSVPVTVGRDGDGHGRGKGETPKDEQEQIAGCAGNHDALAMKVDGMVQGAEISGRGVECPFTP